MLRAVWAGGVRHFDCASAAEVALVRSMFPEAGIHFMHPVKARGAIRAAWGEHGVRDFVLDSAGELAKILAETGAGAAEDLGLFIRLALPKGSAMHDLSGKFGAAPEDAAALLRAARPQAARLGLCFHVGSQMLDPLAWRQAMALAGAVIREAGVAVEVIDVGGGFPVAYPGIEPPPLGAFFAEIEAAFEALDLPGTMLWAEPGRALVAAGGSVVVQVQARRGRDLYVNDGVYGALSDAGVPGFTFPVRLIRPDAPPPVATQDGFVLFGPTCDSADRMQGPFRLPEDVREGDWIEIGQLGAYGACLRTAFNGFDRARLVEVRTGRCWMRPPMPRPHWRPEAATGKAGMIVPAFRSHRRGRRATWLPLSQPHLMPRRMPIRRRLRHPRHVLRQHQPLLHQRLGRRGIAAT